MGFGYALVQLLCILLVQFFEMILEPAHTVLCYAAGWAYMCLLAWGALRSRPSAGTNSTQPKAFTGLCCTGRCEDISRCADCSGYVCCSHVFHRFWTVFARVAAVVPGSASTFLRGVLWRQDAEPASDPLSFHQCGAGSFSFLLCL